MKKALLFQGGWDGHQPKEVSARFARILTENGFQAQVADTLEPLGDLEMLMGLDLIVPCWAWGKSRMSMCKTCLKRLARA